MFTHDRIADTELRSVCWRSDSASGTDKHSRVLAGKSKDTLSAIASCDSHSELSSVLHRWRVSISPEHQEEIPEMASTERLVVGCGRYFVSYIGPVDDSLLRLP